MRSAHGQGRTFEEAVDAALIELGESRRNVDVKVLSESPQVTVVEATVIEPAGEAAAVAAPVGGLPEVARDRVSQLLSKMGIPAQVSIRQREDPIILDVS